MSQTQTETKKLSVMTINTIMTFVISYRESVVLRLEDGYEYLVRWSPTHSEPEVIEPGTTSINYHGIVQVIEWLKGRDVRSFEIIPS